MNVVADPQLSAIARRQAARTRASWLLAVSQRRNSVDDVILAAGAGVAPLLSVRLDRLLTAQTGVGEATAREIIERILRRAGHQRLSHTEVTIGWLLDGRSHGRFDAYLQATRQYESPWPGFPYARAPSDVVATVPSRTATARKGVQL